MQVRVGGVVAELIASASFTTDAAYHKLTTEPEYDHDYLDALSIVQHIHGTKSDALQMILNGIRQAHAILTKRINNVIEIAQQCERILLASPLADIEILWNPYLSAILCGRSVDDFAEPESYPAWPPAAFSPPLNQ